MPTNEVICGDSLQIVAAIPNIRMIFADPPDNTGMKYSGYNDCMPEDDYIDFLKDIFTKAVNNSSIFWMSYFYRYQPEVLMFAKVSGHEWHPLIWRFTFGQHRTDDCGSGYRPLLRVSKPGVQWNTDAIRIESARQRRGDTRANPAGRVPDDVWEVPRVTGNSRERRAWISNQHPERLLERMVLMSTNPGDLVVDMFAGSGTVHRVCKRLGRNSISIDISQDYVDRIKADEDI